MARSGLGSAAALFFMAKRGTLWLDVNAVHTLTQAGEELVRDGSGIFRDLLRTQRVAVASSVKQDFGSYAGARYVS